MKNNIWKSSFLLIKKIIKTSPKLLFISIVEGVCKICCIYIPLIVLPQMLLSLFSNNINEFVLWGTVYFISVEIFSLLSKFFSGKRVVISRYINGKLIKDIYLKPLKVDYEDILKNDFRNEYSRALDEIIYECDYNDIISKFQEIITNLVDFVFALIILFSMISAKPQGGSYKMQFIASPVVSGCICIAILITSVYFNYNVAKKINKKQHKLFNKHATIERKLSYYITQIVFNFNDYGIYHIFDITNLLGNKIIDNTNENVDFFKATRELGISKVIISGIAVSAVTILAYVITGIKILTQAFSVKMLFTYTYSLMNFSNAILKSVSCFQYIQRQIPYFEDLSDFMKKQEEYNLLSTNTKYCEKDCTWELINVSYKYPEQTFNSVSNVTLKIDGNKRHAIVGKNAAGKSTLVLLIIGIIKPTSGKILWNGKDISEFDTNEFRKYLSVVFQDFSLLPTNVGQNVACLIKYDEDKVINCLKRAGFSPENNSYDLNTDVFYQGENARIFSGGQMQKIAIARALYKDGVCFIADEPTASLDPLSEATIYRKILDETMNNTVIFISHRMSSCKDCDDIIVIDNGSVVQQGTHKDLIAQEGVYSFLWNSQAKYYIDK